MEIKLFFVQKTCVDSKTNEETKYLVDGPFCTYEKAVEVRKELEDDLILISSYFKVIEVAIPAKLADN